MNVLNPYVRQFLVGWITVLDSVPEIDMLGFLPDFLDGKFEIYELFLLLVLFQKLNAVNWIHLRFIQHVK